MADQIITYWPQILGILAVVVMFVKLKSHVSELQKDVNDITRRDTYAQVVKLRAELDSLKESTSEKTKALFDLWNQKLK
ncbi:hypothetical protein CMI37_24850 [Candidatus Pacearchaeota archaeon]|nr:hypothetical protein [Candidatus Pacearchaeota archaeon]